LAGWLLTDTPIEDFKLLVAKFYRIGGKLFLAPSKGAEPSFTIRLRPTDVVIPICHQVRLATTTTTTQQQQQQAAILSLPTSRIDITALAILRLID
jgi:hypothetical protein